MPNQLPLKWEYKVLFFLYQTEDQILSARNLMNEAGQEGWEIFQVVSDVDGDLACYAKRMLLDE